MAPDMIRRTLGQSDTIRSLDERFPLKKWQGRQKMAGRQETAMQCLLHPNLQNQYTSDHQPLRSGLPPAFAMFLQTRM
jgi:hypothetical protein